MGGGGGRKWEWGGGVHVHRNIVSSWYNMTSFSTIWHIFLVQWNNKETLYSHGTNRCLGIIRTHMYQPSPGEICIISDSAVQTYPQQMQATGNFNPLRKLILLHVKLDSFINNSNYRIQEGEVGGAWPSHSSKGVRHDPSHSSKGVGHGPSHPSKGVWHNPSHPSKGWVGGGAIQKASQLLLQSRMTRAMLLDTAIFNRLIIK